MSTRSLNKVFIFFKEDFIPFLKGIDNFYMKFILTVIAFSLLYIADDIHTFNNIIICGHIRVGANVSGLINTHVMSGEINANISNPTYTSVPNSGNSYNFDNGF